MLERCLGAPKGERQTVSLLQAPNRFVHPMPTTEAMQLHDCIQDPQSDMQDATSSGNLKKVVGMNVHASRRCRETRRDHWMDSAMMSLRAQEYGFRVVRVGEAANLGPRSFHTRAKSKSLFKRQGPFVDSDCEPLLTTGRNAVLSSDGGEDVIQAVSVCRASSQTRRWWECFAFTHRKDCGGRPAMCAVGATHAQ